MPLEHVLDKRLRMYMYINFQPKALFWVNLWENMDQNSGPFTHYNF